MTRRIDHLNPTINPERDHEFPAMRDGISVKLRAEQILAVGGPDDPQALKDLSNVDPETGRIALDINAKNTPIDDIPSLNLDPADLNVQKAIEATKEYIDTVAASIAVTQSDVRQTVNTGPVDSDGRADFLEAGTGLEVVTKGVSESAPLNITFGDGFDADGKRDVAVVIDNSLSWGSLPDNEDDISLYIRVNRATGTVSTESSLLAPIYSAAEPSAPATGQKWYPTDHRLPMREWNGSEWDNSSLWICIGQCSTDGGSVVEVRSYAYQGRSTIRPGTTPSAGSNIYTHNIGCPNKAKDIVAKFTTGAASYPINDEISLNYVNGGGSDRTIAVVLTNNTATLIRGSNANIILPNKVSGSNSDVVWSNLVISAVRVERAF